MKKFNIGDRVRILMGKDAGTITTVTDGPMEIAASRDGTFPRGIGYEVDLPTTYPDLADRWPRSWIRDFRLELYYDGNERVSWSDCAWKPTGVDA